MPTHLIFLDLIILIYGEAPHYAILSSLILLSLIGSDILLSTLSIHTPKKKDQS